jgi:quinol monooxygenase YgiN
MEEKPMPEKVTVVARIQAQAGKEDEVRQELLRLVTETRKEQGCLNYDLHQLPGDSAQFLFYENWTSQAHLDAHAKSPHIQVFRARGPELLAAPTEITLWRMVSQPQ